MFTISKGSCGHIIQPANIASCYDLII